VPRFDHFGGIEFVDILGDILLIFGDICFFFFFLRGFLCSGFYLLEYSKFGNNNFFL